MSHVKEQTLHQRQVLLLVLVGILVISVLTVSIAIFIMYPPQLEKREYTGPTNILFIVVDDLRPALGCYGDTKAITPNIDALASKSIIFKHAYAQQALCAPSRTSFLTTRRPDSLCLYDNTSGYWRDKVGDFVTMPQHFKNHGYETISVGKIFHHGIVSNKTDDYPYSWSEYPYRPSTEKRKMKPDCPSPNNGRMNLVCPVDVQQVPEKTLPDIQSTEYAIQYLRNKSESSNDTVPFFLGVGYYKPHIPFKFPRDYLDLYPIADMDLAPKHTIPKHLNNVSWNPWMDIRERDDVKALNIPFKSFPFGPLPEDFQKLVRQGYYASLSYMDDELGKLLEALEDTGFAEHTTIVLLGDHGWSLGEHQEWSKYSNFEVSVKVPLIVHVPGLTEKERKPFKRTPVLDLIPENRKLSNVSFSKSIPKYVSDELVELVDLFPTLAEISKLPIPPLCRLYPTVFCSEGISFYRVIEHHVLDPTADFSWKTGVFSQYPRPSEEIEENSDQPQYKDIKIMGYSIRTDRYRYTEWISFNTTVCKPEWHQIVSNELYDHKHDPYESNSVSSKPVYSNTVKELSKKIRSGWRHTLPDDFFNNL